MKRNVSTIAFCAFALAACGSGGSTGSSNDGGSGSSSGGGGSSSGSRDGGGEGGMACTPAGNTISGAVGGTAFNTVAAALWIQNQGAPDQTTTTTLYLFDKTVACSDIQSAGWDTRITAGTQVLEVKMWGTSPQTFTITTSHTPAPGEADAPYTVAGAGAMDDVSTGGTVKLATLSAGMKITGCFASTYSNGTLTGTFDAIWCSGGVEP